jgi:16S rRNA (uracil1498-N3)-methyltransferase
MSGERRVRHRFFVPPDQIQADTVFFADDQAHQIHSVLRLRKGDTVIVFDGVEAVDHVVALTGRSEGQITGTQAQPPEPTTRLVAYPSLLQRDKFELVLQKLTEVGVAAVVPVLTARGLVRRLPDEHRQTRWGAIVREAAEQSGRGRVPGLAPAMRFGEAIGRATVEGTVVIAFEGERAHRLCQALEAAHPTVSLFVGPEGGFDPEEVACARQAGAQIVTLGPRVLRAETASVVLAALALYELELR